MNNETMVTISLKEYDKMRRAGDLLASYQEMLIACCSLASERDKVWFDGYDIGKYLECIHPRFVAKVLAEKLRNAEPENQADEK